MNWNLKSTWDENYRLTAEPLGHPANRPGICLGYTRAVLYAAMEQRAKTLVSILGISPPGPAIIIVGAGFGWTAEALEKMGFTRVVATDTSAYIHAEKYHTEEEEIDRAIRAVGLDPKSGVGLERKRQLFDGGPRCRLYRGIWDVDIMKRYDPLGFDIAITERVLECLSDVLAIKMNAACHRAARDVYHYLEPNMKAPFNGKSLKEWQDFLPNSTIVEAR